MPPRRRAARDRSTGAPRDRILIVDDEDVFRAGLVKILSGDGHDCVEASNASEARERLRTEAGIVAVLCDIQMPGESGIELLKGIASDFPDLAVVMVTAVDDPATAEVAIEIGAYGYVVKPFDRNEIRINLLSALKRREVEARRKEYIRSLEEKVMRMKAVIDVRERFETSEAQTWIRPEETIDRLSRAVSLRDEETGSHIERMSRYSAMLAQKVSFAGASTEDVRLASALHDVGKIGVPDSILLKPGALDPDEYALMQRHAQLGYRLLNGSASDLLKLGGLVALSHHEWWDGSGYPQGLHGDEIPELARIAAVSDVFDALTSDRVYRPAMAFEDAIDIIIDLRGRQFEPRLSDAFLSSIDEVRAIRDANPDVEAHGVSPIRVLVVDDNTMVAESLVRLLGDKEGVEVLGRAASLAEARALAAAHEPDVILMDFELPDGDGAAATREIKMVTPSAKVVMLTARTDEDDLVRAIAAGCSGFVAKHHGAETLVRAIRSAHQGEAVISSERLPALLERLRPTHRGLSATLTPREIEILGLIASGLDDDAIAQRISVSPETVRTHVQNVLYKLQVHSKLEAVATAAREGVIDHRWWRSSSTAWDG